MVERPGRVGAEGVVATTIRSTYMKSRHASRPCQSPEQSAGAGCTRHRQIRCSIFADGSESFALALARLSTTKPPATYMSHMLLQTGTASVVDVALACLRHEYERRRSEDVTIDKTASKTLYHGEPRSERVQTTAQHDAAGAEKDYWGRQIRDTVQLPATRVWPWGTVIRPATLRSFQLVYQV